MCTTYPDRPQHRKLNTKTSESNTNTLYTLHCCWYSFGAHLPFYRLAPLRVRPNNSHVEAVKEIHRCGGTMYVAQTVTNFRF